MHPQSMRLGLGLAVIALSSTIEDEHDPASVAKLSSTIEDVAIWEEEFILISKALHQPSKGIWPEILANSPPFSQRTAKQELGTAVDEWSSRPFESVPLKVMLSDMKQDMNQAINPVRTTARVLFSTSI